MSRNRLTARLGISFPLIQAGMGGVAGPELAAAVASAGAGGVLALYRMPPAAVGMAVQRVRHLTAAPFGVNLIPELMESGKLSGQVSAALEASGAHTFFVFYGLPQQVIVAPIVNAGNPFLVMVGNAQDAAKAEAIGADGVILQGIEAGGHLLGAKPLDQLLLEVRQQGGGIPILGAGGIGSGQDLWRIEKHGASGCLCGTLFVATEESQAHPFYKTRVIEAAAEDTVVTGIFDVGWSARLHRVLKNRLTDLGELALPQSFIATMTVAGQRFPIPRYSAMVPTASTVGKVEEMAMYCGTSVARVSEILCAQRRVDRFIAEYDQARNETG